MLVPNEEILQALLSSSRFQFKSNNNKYLSGGKCPQCGGKSLWVNKDKPFYLNCNHKNSCGYEGTVKDEIPELFTGWEERFPATKEEPERTANVYLSMDRGFDISKLRGWYTQEACRLDNGKYCATVRFYLDEKRTRFWERLIGHTWKDGQQRAKFGGKRKEDGTLYAGDAWTPPGQELVQGERCYIVEGIFHAIALHMTGRKVAAALSCGNMPVNYIKEHKGKGIRWTLALDGDKAGRPAMRKHVKRIRAMEETAQVCLLPNNGQDWDDLYRAGKLTDDFMAERLHWGRVFLAESVEESAYHRYCKKKRESMIFAFKNQIYEVRVPMTTLDDELAKQEAALESSDGKLIFYANCATKMLCNVYPECLYREVDEIANARWYVFRINYEHLDPEIIRLEGSELTSSAVFNAALIDKTAGGSWTGDAGHFRYLSLKWFKKAQHRLVKSVPYQGYVREFEAYVFEGKAFYKNQEVFPNDDGLFRVGKHGIKTNLSLSLCMKGKFDPSWVNDYVTAFSMPGLSVLAFWLGSLFVGQIRAQQSSFPFLEFTGDAGAGKTTVLEFLWKCCGRDDYEGFDLLKATDAGGRRSYNQLSGMPTVLIESDRDNGNPHTKAKQFDFDNLKAFYNGRSTGTLGVAKRGNDVEESPFRGTIIISQNAEVDGSQALLQRIVHCHADKSHHGPGTRDVARWFERQTPETVGGFIRKALTNESTILKRYYECFDIMEARFTPHLRNERVCKNHAQVAACACALPILFPDLKQETIDQVADYLLERAQARERRLDADHPEVERFWELYHYLNEESCKVGEGRLNHSGNEDEIALSPNEFEAACRNEGLKIPDMRQVRKLLPNSQRHKFIKKNASVWSTHTRSSKKCWVFRS